MMHFRKYTSQDKNACLAIFDSNCPPFFGKHERAEFELWLDNPDRPDYFVYEEKLEILACGGIYEDSEKDTVGFSWGMVRRDWHGKGLGSKLAELRLELLTKEYPGKSCLLATSQLTSSFYEKHGFIKTKQVKDGFAKGIDKISMIKPAKGV